MASNLKITSKGQITLKKSVLAKTGLRPGDYLEVEVLTSGVIQLRPKAKKPIQALYGFFKDYSGPRITIDELNSEIEKFWAGEK